jgi:hypothetical protein
MQSQNLEKVVEKLATTERITIVYERSPEGKLRVTSGSWEGGKSFSGIRCSRFAMSSSDCISLAKPAP